MVVKDHRCKLCKHVGDESSFCSTVNGKESVINHEVGCNSNCVVYLMTCKVCNLQYVGETCSEKFRLRYNNYVSKNKKCLEGLNPSQKFLHQHFLQPDHHGLENDAVFQIIDKTDPRHPKKREKFWISQLETMVPNGLNTSSQV